MIRSALAELGCEEAPSGCPDLSAETVGVDSLDGSSPDHQVLVCTIVFIVIFIYSVKEAIPNQNFDHQDRGSIGSKTSSDVLRLHLHSIIPPRPFFKLFTRPFRRKSAPSSPALPPKTYRSSSEGPSDSVTANTHRIRRYRVLKHRFRERVHIYVHCRVHHKTLFKKRRRSRIVVNSCPNSVVSATNRTIRHPRMACFMHAKVLSPTGIATIYTPRIERQSNCISAKFSKDLASPCTARTSVENMLSYKMKIARTLFKTQFQNQGEDAYDVPEMYRLRVVCVRNGCEAYVKFILLCPRLAACGENKEIIK